MYKDFSFDTYKIIFYLVLRNHNKLSFLYILQKEKPYQYVCIHKHTYVQIKNKSSSHVRSVCMIKHLATRGITQVNYIY